MTNRALQLAYMNGIIAARKKIATAACPIIYDPLPKTATVAGPIAHAGGPGDARANEKQELWAEFDREPFQTGEESGLGMPTAGGVNKAAGITALLTQQFNRDNKKRKPKSQVKPYNVPYKKIAALKTADSGDGTYGHDAGYGEGGYDHDAADPNRFKHMSSAMQRAFEANEDYDQSYSDEPALTQPHGSKYAAGMGLGGMTSGMPSSSTSMMGVAGAPKPPQAPQMPQAPKLPGVGKAPSAVDPRGDKPPGMNLQHSLQTNVSSADSAAGFGSPQRRAMGSSI
jgi:hypothetical protein